MDARQSRNYNLALARVLRARSQIQKANARVTRSDPNVSDETIAAWVRRRFGDEFAARVADPMVSGIYAGDPERLSLDATFPAVHDLEQAHSRLLAFGRVAGMWECIFTSSRFVLGLDHIPFVRLSAAYQRVIVDAAGETGHHVNIAELCRGSAVKCVCGEYANIRPSALDDARLDVQYEWFYFSFRVSQAHAGHIEFADALETGREHGDLRLPFHGRGWQSTVYLSHRVRIVRGNQGGIFVMIRKKETGSADCLALPLCPEEPTRLTVLAGH